MVIANNVRKVLSRKVYVISVPSFLQEVDLYVTVNVCTVVSVMANTVRIGIIYD